jgi:hypothetical protein
MNVRPLLAAALAALLTAPLAASAQARPAARSAPAAAPRSLAVGGWLGYEMGDLDGVALRLEGELPFQQLTPEIALSLVGSVGYSRLSDDLGRGFDITANLLKFVPAARFTLPVSPELSLFGDAGLGLYYASVSTDFEFFNPITGRVERDDASDSSVGLMMRLGVGGFFQVNPQLRLGGALVLDPMFGDYDDTTFTIQVGASFQL